MNSIDRAKRPTWEHLLRDHAPIRLPSAHDALTARILERVRFYNIISASSLPVLTLLNTYVGKRLVFTEWMVSKIRAALGARSKTDFFHDYTSTSDKILKVQHSVSIYSKVMAVHHEYLRKFYIQ